MDVKQIRRDIAAAANGVKASNGQALATTAYVPGAIDPPFAYCADTDGTYHETMDGAAGAVVTLRILTSRAEDRSGQEMLDDYLASLGPTSVAAAIEAAVPGANVTGFAGYQLFEVAGIEYFGAELTIVVLA